MNGHEISTRNFLFEVQVLVRLFMEDEQLPLDTTFFSLCHVKTSIAWHYWLRSSFLQPSELNQREKYSVLLNNTTHSPILESNPRLRDCEPDTLTAKSYLV